jgi:hypothetical protein
MASTFPSSSTRRGSARNIGIKATRAPYVAFLASDCRATQGWARKRLAAHRRALRRSAAPWKTASRTTRLPGPLIWHCGRGACRARAEDRLWRLLRPAPVRRARIFPRGFARWRGRRIQPTTADPAEMEQENPHAASQSNATISAHCRSISARRTAACFEHRQADMENSVHPIPRSGEDYRGAFRRCTGGVSA